MKLARDHGHVVTREDGLGVVALDQGLGEIDVGRAGMDLDGVIGHAFGPTRGGKDLGTSSDRT